ncbi:PREDICTED: protein ALTERED XYLOGLUCAN 4-like [Tarenaya hassleriana]|uniref:protein ALTERED XYLOGLUCAN 4-like n=1 Tax=Tarenaya hassleriana TaxID=28532 RepID=UPI00053C4593|nr:PREDICTED: protein ALTERED XYLOGLUCAN 4-like [Tarenaya hassleriana]
MYWMKKSNKYKKSFFLPEMGFKEQASCLNQKKLAVYTVLAFLLIALFRLWFYYPFSAIDGTLLQDSAHIVINSYSSSSSSSPEEEAAGQKNKPLCDYTDGKWVRGEMGPLYNGTTCGTIKDGQNCLRHGRPDSGYLYWKWKPNQCDIPRFDPTRFLDLLRDKHLAFIGDSMARNQLESLLCMLATFSTPNLVYRNGEDNKFRRWLFKSHNLTVSVYWSPFLVAGKEKSTESGLDHNVLHLERVDEKWAKDLDQMDVVVLSVGHWFLHPAMYLESGSVLGCHSCPARNCTEIGFFEVFRKAIRTTLRSVVSNRGRHRHRDVVLTTFSPSHFEGRPWDSLGACNMTEPYEGKALEGMDEEMRRIEMEEVAAANAGTNTNVEALDVTGLSILRPDGHPGPYMYAFPFKNGVPDRIHNDCLHWCLPGPVDTWNEILLEVLRRWMDHVW